MNPDMLLLLRLGLLSLTTCALSVAAQIEFKVAGETVVVPASFAAKVVPVSDPWRMAFESKTYAANPDWRAPDIYLEMPGKPGAVRTLLLITAVPLGVEGLKTYHDTDTFRQMFPADGKVLPVDSKDERYVVYFGQQKEQPVLFAVALCRGKVLRLSLISLDDSGVPADHDFIDGRTLRQLTQLLVQSNPIDGANQINTNLMSWFVAIFGFLGAIKLVLHHRSRIKAESLAGAK